MVLEKVVVMVELEVLVVVVVEEDGGRWSW